MVETGRPGEAMKKKQEASQKQKQRPPEQSGSPSYRAALRSIFSCRHSHNADAAAAVSAAKAAACSSSSSSCMRSHQGRKNCFLKADSAKEPCKRRASVSTCSERSVKKHHHLTVARRPPPASRSISISIAAAVTSSSSSSSSTGGSFRSLQLRKLSGCYECHNMAVDPASNAGGSLRSSICPCPSCGEIFARPESLETHQSIRHAVSELEAADTSRNVIEIIFQSSWLKKQTPAVSVDRILKVHNAERTVARFEEYRDAIKGKANRRPSSSSKKHPRCIADGNELLRFHCAALLCPLGLNGATNLCGGIPRCAACGIIRDGFKAGADGAIRTTATSGRAHDMAAGERRAMLVCRVIAGRVKRGAGEAGEEYDSVAGEAPAGVYSNLEELLVYSPRAILPCFVVIYTA